MIPFGGGKYADCPGECNAGQVHVEMSLGGRTIKRDMDCPVCNGEGFVDDRPAARLARDPEVVKAMEPLVGTDNEKN